MHLHSINRDGRFYFIKSNGRHFSSIEFDVAADRTQAVCEWLLQNGVGVLALFIRHTTVGEAVAAVRAGSEEGFSIYRRVMDRGAYLHETRGVRCPAELSPQLTGLEGRRVLAVDLGGHAYRFTVGRSTGWMPCHLECSCAGAGGYPARKEYKSITVL